MSSLHGLIYSYEQLGTFSSRQKHTRGEGYNFTRQLEQPHNLLCKTTLFTFQLLLFDMVEA